MKRSATIIGSGPNGLAAAIVLAQSGFDVEVREAASVPGGAASSGELTLPGFVHDLGSAVHPFVVASPFFSTLDLEKYGLRWIESPAVVAHPLDDGPAVTVERDIVATASQLEPDAVSYRRFMAPFVKNWNALISNALSPLLRWPENPFLMARFGLHAVRPALGFAMGAFRGQRARTVFAGMAAHSNLPFEALLGTGFGLILGTSAHAGGWPIPAGGAQNITNALVRVLESFSGRVITNARVHSLSELEGSDAVLCDVTPRQFLSLAGDRLPSAFRRSLQHYRYSPGVCKVDWALRQPIPWKDSACLRAATVHLGGSLEEIAASERAVWRDEHVDKPFVLLSQPSVFDPTRAPEGRHTVWAYCHIPNGSTVSMVDRIEAQIERFAPGFRDCILGKASHMPADMEQWNANLVGGDITGGAATLKQFLFRPTWKRYRTPLKGVYLCSSSTPPGGGVHGMCGYHAAQCALADS
jgi:phytoene dehydrogenase-like protein